MSLETNYKYFIGIDVAKYKIDIFNTITGEYRTIKNNETEILKYINEVNSLLLNEDSKQTINKEDILIIIDLTGGYEKVILNTFYKSGYRRIIRAEGLKVKNFSKSIKYNRAKTDKKDAEILVEYGRHFYNKLPLYEPEEEIRKYITDLYNRIEDLKYIQQQEKNRLKQPNITDIMKTSIKEMLITINNEIERLRTEIMNNIDLIENSKLKLIYNTLKEQEGIGKEIALFILIKLREIGELERKQLTSISGLAPIPNDSGTIKGHRYVRGGRKEIRSKMYLCAMNMLRFNIKFQNKMKEMIKKGKNKKVIITALARKEITILNAIVRDKLKEKGYI